MIGGAHTYGVYGAARAFSYEGEAKEAIQYQNCKVITDSLGYEPEFCVTFEVHGTDQTVDPPLVNSHEIRNMKS